MAIKKESIYLYLPVLPQTNKLGTTASVFQRVVGVRGCIYVCVMRGIGVIGVVCGPASELKETSRSELETTRLGFLTTRKPPKMEMDRN